MKGQQLSSKWSDYDLFAIQPSLRIKGRDQMASIVGLLLTLVIFLSLFGLTIYLFVKMIVKDNPSVTVSEEVTNAIYGDHVTIGLNSTSFYFGFGFFTEDVVSDPEILDINVTGYDYTYITPNQITFTSFNTNAVLCDWYDQYGQWDNQGFCIERDVTLLSGMEGPDHSGYQSLKIYLSPCSEQRGSEICKHPDRINEILHKSEFRVTYTHPHINHHDYDQPITLDYINYEEWILPGYTKTLTFFVTKIKIITDNGWLFESEKEQEAVVVQTQRTTIQPRYNEHDPFFKFVITANDKVIIYKRSYTKIQNVFADITGLASFIVLILALFARPFFQFKMNEALVNSIYDVMINGDVRAPVIGIIDKNPSNNDDKKDGDDRDPNFQRSASVRNFIHTRSKSSKVGIDGPTNKTSTVYATQSTCKSEKQPGVGDIANTRENNKEKEPRPLGTNRKLLHSKTVHVCEAQRSGRQENIEPDIKDSEIITKDPIPKEEGNRTIEIEMEAGEQSPKTKQASVPTRTRPSFAYRSKTIPVYQTQQSLRQESLQPEITDLEISKQEEKAEKETEIELKAGGNSPENNRVSAPTQTLTSLQLGHISKTSSVYQPQRVLKNEINPIVQEDLEVEDLEISNKKLSEAINDLGIQEETGKDNGLVEIELEAGGGNLDNNQIPIPAQIPPTLEPRFKIDISFKEWLLSFFRPQLQVKILQEAEELLSRNLDIVTVVKKMSDINKLKECLLTDQQRILFDNLPHSFVLLDPVTRKKSSQGEMGDGRIGSSEENGEDKVKEAYLELRDSRNKSEVDSRILSLYEKKCLKFSASEQR